MKLKSFARQKASIIIAFAFSLAAEIERNLISQRTEEALAAKKLMGIKLGMHRNTLRRFLNEAEAAI